MKWKDSYGFIRPDGARGGRDLFVIWSAIVDMNGHRALNEGDRVTFTRSTDDQGRPQAVDVRLVEAA